MTWQIQLFLNAADEDALSHRLREEHSHFFFIDGGTWPTSEPPEKPAISDCSQRYVYIWPKWLFPQLPVCKRPDGTYDGPISGMVIQICRSIGPSEFSVSSIRPPVLALSSGRIAWGGDSTLARFEQMKELVKSIRRIINKIFPTKLIAVDPRTRRPILQELVGYYRVGNHAAEWCRLNERHFLKDAAVPLYFRPISEGNQ